MAKDLRRKVASVMGAETWSLRCCTVRELVEGRLGKTVSVAEADSSGMECLRSKVEDVGKRVREASCGAKRTRWRTFCDRMGGRAW